MDPRINPDKDFVFKEDTLLENALDTLYKLPIYAAECAEARAKVDRAKQELENVQAMVSLLIRQQNQEKKITENTVTSLVTSNERTQKAWEVLTQAQRELYYAEGYWKAIQKTCDMIQMIGYTKNSEMKRL